MGTGVSDRLFWGAECHGGSDRGLLGNSGAALVGMGQAMLRQRRLPLL